MTKLMRKLLEDVILELTKSGNEDATNLIDRIDRILSAKKYKGEPQPEIPGDLQLSDFIPEFIDKLIDQLKLDHNRWGNTWLKRTKNGQEDRTRKCFDNYFDQFEFADVPVPWLKIVGNALICWIRDNHPELGWTCLGECEDEGKSEVMGVKVSGEGVKDITNSCTCEGVDATIKILGHDGPCKLDVVNGFKVGDLVHLTVSNGYQRCAYNWTIVDFASNEAKVIILNTFINLQEIVKIDDIIPQAKIVCTHCGRDDTVLYKGFCNLGCPDEGAEAEKPVEEMATKELIESTVPTVQHKSDCAVHNEPALPKGECDCQDRNELTIHDIVSNPVAHVEGENIRHHNGILEYSAASTKIDGMIILSSVRFTLGSGNGSTLIAWCNADGSIYTDDMQSKRIEGHVTPSGIYSFTEVCSIDLDKDEVCISYDYGGLSMDQKK